MKKFYALLITVFFCAALMPQQAKASHVLGGDFSYECISTGGGNNTYRIKYTMYRDCEGITASSSVTATYSSASCGLSGTVTLTPVSGCTTPQGYSNGAELPGVCGSATSQTTCNGGTLPGVEVYIYCGTVTLPADCPDWIIGYGECCRNAAITNISGASSYNGYVDALINNANGICNNSPFFTSSPSELYCATNSYCYNQGAVDLDGDSLAFSLVPALSAQGTPITAYNSPQSPTSPMSVMAGTSFTFDSLTGQMCFTPDVPQAAVIAIEVREYRGGVLIGTTRRDIQFQVLSSALCTGGTPSTPTVSAPVGAAPIDSVSLQMCNGGTVSFNVRSTDSTGATTLTMVSNATTSIPSSSFPITGNGTSTVNGSFSWTPTAADTGLHFFTVTVTNNACPIPRSVTQTIKVFVYSTVTAASSAPAFCGDSVQLTAIGGSIFTWTPSTGLSNPNIPNPMAGPAAATTYTVTTECGSDTITVGVGAPYTVNAGADVSICLNGTAPLNATVNGGTPPFTYQWRPSSPASVISNPNILNPIVGPTVTTPFILTVTSAEGCIATDTVRVIVSGVAPNISAFATPDTVCPGGTVQLDLTTSPQGCGASSRPCVTSSIDYTVGTGTSTNTGGTTYPAVYGNYYESAQHQILYTASELNAMGISGGTLTSIAFNIASYYSSGGYTAASTYQNFAINIKCTSLSSLSSWSTGGFTTVFTPKTVGTTTGWNTNVFDVPYDWDGVSNLLVQVCFDNSSLCANPTRCYTYNTSMPYTTTPFTSVLYYRIDDPSVCGTIPSLSGSSPNRPNTRFGVCQQGLLPGAIITWTPSTGLSDPNDINPIAQVFQTTTYTASVTEGACVGSDFVTVIVNNNLSVAANPQDTSFCTPTPLTLTAVATGTPSPQQLSCGINGTACGGPAFVDTVGQFAQITTTTTPYKGSEYESHVQMIYKASELQAAGFTRGVISSLAFYVSNKGSSAAFQQFTIKMGCTNQDTLNGFVTGLATVYGPVNQTTTNASWNTYTLAAPYDWDGYSNILVEVCFGNGSSTIGDDIIRATPTGFSSVVYVATSSFNFISGCDIPDAPSLSALRPDLRFSICPPPPGEFVFTWRPIAGTGPTLTGDTVTITPLTNVTYQVEVTDSFCYAYDTVVIQFLNGYSANLSGSNIGCNGSNTGDVVSTPLAGSSPYDFVWTDASGTVLQTTIDQAGDTLLNLGPGMYFVDLTDNNGCTARDSITLTVPPPLTIDNIAITNVGCYGEATGQAAVMVSGGTMPYRYLWSPGAITVPIATGLTAGTYNVVVTDSSGCQVFDTIVITEPAAILYTMASTDVSCYQGADGTASVTVTSGGSGNFTYLWSNALTIPAITNLTTGTYTVTVTDVVGGCTIIDSVLVDEPDSFIIVIAGVVDASCYNTADGQASASVNSVTTGYTFLWSNGENTAAAIALPQGINTVTVTDANGCPQSTTVTIGSPPRFFLRVDTTDVTCNNGNDGTATVSVTSGGTPPFAYLWSDPAAQTGATATGLAAGTYYVTVTDNNGCPEYDTATINEPPAITVSLAVVPATCFGATDGGVTATPSGGTPPYTYQWSAGSSTTGLLNGVGEGTYTVTVTDNNGCSVVDSILVGQPSAALSYSDTVVNVSCPGENNGGIFALGVGGTGPYLYSLNGSTPQSNGNFITLPAANGYQLTITDANGCSVDALIDITEPDPFTVFFVPEIDSMDFGDSVLLTPIVEPAGAGDIYSWSPSTYLSCDTCFSPYAFPPIHTVYELTVVRGNNCPQTARVQVIVDNDKVFYIPNSFTPNGDGFNDYFMPYTKGGTHMMMKIFDEWGSVMYSYDGPMGGAWDGNYKGNILPPDTYVYYIEVTYEDESIKSSKGSVIIFK